MINQQECLDRMRAGESVNPAEELGAKMLELSARGRAIVARMNREAITDGQAREFFAELTDREIPESFQVFLPFTSDFGLNIDVGPNVFINAGCRFQDQGGITIAEGALIGHNVVIATLNHDLDPAKRAVMHPAAVHIGAQAWIGAGAIILPGITVGAGAVVGAGSVVTKDVPPGTVVVGNPARVVKTIGEG